MSLPHEKHQKKVSFLMFSGGKERVNWEQMGYVVRTKMDLRLRRKEKDLNYLSI